MRKIQDVRFRGFEEALGPGPIISPAEPERGGFDPWWKYMSVRESLSDDGNDDPYLLSDDDASRLRRVYSADECCCLPY